MHIQKKKHIERFIQELEVAQSEGYVFSVYKMLEKTSFEQIVSVGAEILFSDVVKEKHIYAIKEYIENKYGFFVDATTLYHPLIQIIVVKYEQ